MCIRDRLPPCCDLRVRIEEEELKKPLLQQSVARTNPGCTKKPGMPIASCYTNCQMWPGLLRLKRFKNIAKHHWIVCFKFRGAHRTPFVARGPVSSKFLTMTPATQPGCANWLHKLVIGWVGDAPHTLMRQWRRDGSGLFVDCTPMTPLTITRPDTSKTLALYESCICLLTYLLTYLQTRSKFVKGAFSIARPSVWNSPQVPEIDWLPSKVYEKNAYFFLAI